MSDNVCLDPSYKYVTCDGTSYTKPQLESYSSTLDFAHDVNKKIVLSYGLNGNTIDINKRTRTFKYESSNDLYNTNGRVVIVGDGLGAAEIDCFDQTKNLQASLSDIYTTVDTTFMYIDLRYDLFVYKEIEKTMELKKAVNGNDGESLVSIKNSSEKWFPFIFENTPIKVITTYFCTGVNGLQPEIIKEESGSGYWNGIRTLLPLFNSSEPFGMFTQDGVRYNAEEVDWYYMPKHREADGDEFFWWADWHKAMSINNQIDELEAQSMWQVLTGQLSNPYKRTLDYYSILKTIVFTGSVAINKNKDAFISMSFIDTPKKINKLILKGSEVAIPTDEVQDRDMDGNVQRTDYNNNPLWLEPKTSEYDAWYPISPL